MRIQGLRCFKCPPQGLGQAPLLRSAELLSRWNHRLPTGQRKLALGYRRTGERSSAEQMGEEQRQQPDQGTTQGKPLPGQLMQSPASDQQQRRKPTAAHPATEAGQGWINRQDAAADANPEQGRV